MHDWLSVDEAPDISVEAPKLCLNFQETLGVGDSRNDFLLITDNAGVVQQGL